MKIIPYELGCWLCPYKCITVMTEKRPWAELNLPSLLTLLGRGFWMLLEVGGGWISPHLLDHQESLWKNDFWKLIMNSNEKSWEMGPPALFFMEKWTFEKSAGWISPIRVKVICFFINILGKFWRKLASIKSFLYLIWMNMDLTLSN